MRTPPKNEGFDMRPRVLDTDPHYKKLSPAAKDEASGGIIGSGDMRYIYKQS